MGGTPSQIKLEKISAKNLVNGDHIVKKGFFRNQHAIYIDNIMGTCVCLDSQSGMITETHITNFCQNQNKLYKANYNNVIKQSTEQIVANARKFVAREYFSTCCLSTSFNFCFNCSTNRYTTVRYPAVPTLTINDIKELKKKYDVDNAGDINDTKKYATQHQIKVSPSKSISNSNSCNIVKIEQNSIESGNIKNNNDNNGDITQEEEETEISEEHKTDLSYDVDMTNQNGVPKRLLNLINMSNKINIKKFEPQSTSKSLKSQDIGDPSIELEHITVPLPFVNENKDKNININQLNNTINKNSPSRSETSTLSCNSSDMCIVEPEITSSTSSNSNSDEFVPVIIK